MPFYNLIKFSKQKNNQRSQDIVCGVGEHSQSAKYIMPVGSRAEEDALGEWRDVTLGAHQVQEADERHVADGDIVTFIWVCWFSSGSVVTDR